MRPPRSWGSPSSFFIPSCHSRQAGPRSDWDIGIVGPAPLDGAILERIREALDELPTLATFQVVDLSTVPEGFRDRALREGTALE